MGEKTLLYWAECTHRPPTEKCSVCLHTKSQSKFHQYENLKIWKNFLITVVQWGPCTCRFCSSGASALSADTPSQGLHNANNADWSRNICASIWTHLQYASRVLPVQGQHCWGHPTGRLDHQPCRCWQLPGGTECQQTAAGCNQWGAHEQPPTGASTAASWRWTRSLHNMHRSGAHTATYGHA